MKHRSLLISLIAPMLMLSWSLASLGQAPSGLKGTIGVLNKSGHDASFIDLASGSIVATLTTRRGPHELIVTSDGRWAPITVAETASPFSMSRYQRWFARLISAIIRAHMTLFCFRENAAW